MEGRREPVRDFAHARAGRGAMSKDEGAQA